MIQHISDSARYIGVDDHELDLFESQYSVPDGMSYNSYLILDEKIAILDTVDISKIEQWVENLQRELAGRTPDYIIVTHMEPDHAAGLVRALELYPSMQIVGNAKTFGMIPQFFSLDISERQVVVKEGDTLELGEHFLKFMMAPMVHWPEVMVVYDSFDQTLYSADAFGKFGALDAPDPEGWTCEARRYYYNIVGKYGTNVQSLLKKLDGTPISTIAPLHGEFLGGKISYYIGMYDMWSRYQFEDRGVMIAYASIHGNTAEAAEKMAEVLREQGVEHVKLFDLCRGDQSFMVEDAFQTQHLILAAASYDAGVFPPMEHFLHHLKSKNYQGRKVGIIENGSWAPTAGKVMRAALEGMKSVEIFDETITIRSCYKEENRAAMQRLAEWFSRES